MNVSTISDLWKSDCAHFILPILLDGNLLPTFLISFVFHVVVFFLLAFKWTLKLNSKISGACHPSLWIRRLLACREPVFNKRFLRPVHLLSHTSLDPETSACRSDTPWSEGEANRKRQLCSIRNITNSFFTILACWWPSYLASFQRFESSESGMAHRKRLFEMNCVPLFFAHLVTRVKMCLGFAIARKGKD